MVAVRTFDLTHGPGGGIVHFGFRLLYPPGDIDAARSAVEKAGGTIREHGNFVPAEPYLFALGAAT